MRGLICLAVCQEVKLLSHNLHIFHLMQLVCGPVCGGVLQAAASRYFTWRVFVTIRLSKQGAVLCGVIGWTESTKPCACN